MESNRRQFLKLACGSGICSCAGTGFLAGEATAGVPQEPDPMPRKWIAALLPALQASADPVTAAQVLKGAAEAHYQHLRMDERVAPYRGDLGRFLAFLSSEWGWKIEYAAGSTQVLIDENKPNCVCPLVAQGLAGDPGLLCNCSEGFAERMFSAVVGTPVRAEVTASVLRGAPSCRYRITLPA
jgi:hypothetical protein